MRRTPEDGEPDCPSCESPLTLCHDNSGEWYHCEFCGFDGREEMDREEDPANYKFEEAEDR